jgi:hypothetical protein
VDLDGKASWFRGRGWMGTWVDRAVGWAARVSIHPRGSGSSDVLAAPRGRRRGHFQGPFNELSCVPIGCIF